MPNTAPPLIPPLCPPAEAAEDRDGFAPAELTPLHRSAEALLAEAGAGAELFSEERAAELLEGAVALLGAVELANTAWPPSLATPAVAPLTRALTAPVLRAAGVDGAGAVRGACARAA